MQGDYVKRADVVDLLQKCTWGKTQREAIDEAYRIPAADVVEIVRCKDCIHNNDCDKPISPAWIREMMREYPGMESAMWAKLLRLHEEQKEGRNRE